MPLSKPATITVHEQAMTYNELAPSFPPERMGQWVLIAGMEPQGFFSSAAEAEWAADEKGFDLFNRYIRRVGSPLPCVIVMGEH